MKLFSFLLFLFITIEYIQSKKILRTYIAHRDNVIKGNTLSSYTIYESAEKKIIYKLIPSSSPIVDFMTLFDYPDMNITANLKGEWLDKTIDVTFSIYDKRLNKSINGTIIKYTGNYLDRYFIHYNSKRIEKTSALFGKTVKLSSTPSKQLIAEFIDRSGWSGKVKKAVNIYSNEYPDALYFFVMAIEEQRYQMFQA